MSAALAKVMQRAVVLQDVIGGIEPVTARRCQTDCNGDRANLRLLQANRSKRVW